MFLFINAVSCPLPLSLSVGDDLPVLNIEKETPLSDKGNCVHSRRACVSCLRNLSSLHCVSIYLQKEKQ